MKNKKALITGVTGQDGIYLTEFLIEKGYEVHGMIRWSVSNLNAVKPEIFFHERFFPHFGDLSDYSTIFRLIKKVKPDEIYNLGSQSHVVASFKLPEYTANITGMGALRILEAVKNSGIETKFYQASSSEMFGKAIEPLQTESTPFNPCSPYSCSKVFAHYITKSYREAYGMFACNGISFNHESPLRGHIFVTRKITKSLVRIKLGLQNKIKLGNLNAKRDWGYAKDYVEGMWMMLQQHNPDDYILATGETHSVREFVEESAKVLGMEIVWKGKGLKEKGINKNTGKTIIEIDPVHFRPLEVDVLIGNASKARKKLGWKPKVKFKELVKIMTKADDKKEKEDDLKVNIIKNNGRGLCLWEKRRTLK